MGILDQISNKLKEREIEYRSIITIYRIYDSNDDPDFKIYSHSYKDGFIRSNDEIYEKIKKELSFKWNKKIEIMMILSFETISAPGNHKNLIYCSDDLIKFFLKI